MNRSRAAGLASLVLALVVMRHYGWQVAPDELRGTLSKALGAFEPMALAWIVYALARHPLTLAAVLYATFEHLQTFACSLFYMAAPWPVRPGKPICSELAGLDIGALTIIIAALVLARIYPVIYYSGREPDGASE